MIKYSYSSILFIFLSFTYFPSQILSNEEVKSSRRDIQGRIEIRAIMVNCHPELITKAPRKPYNEKESMSSDIAEFRGFGRDEITMHSLVKDCKRKLVITMRLKNDKKTVTEEQFIVVDHVYDPVFKKRSRLLNPFVFKIKQNQVLQLYGLQFQNIVNAEVTEEVINKNQDNFTGCDVTSSHPTCGFSLSKDRQVIPFSEGFCCSCDAYINSQRQPHNAFTTSRSLHRIGPSPIHVKTHNFPRHNRDALHDNSVVKSKSDQKARDESNDFLEDMQSNGNQNLGMLRRSNSSLFDDDQTIPSQKIVEDQSLLKQKDGLLENSLDFISHNEEILKAKHYETQNSYLFPNGENIPKNRRSIAGSYANNIGSDLETTCISSEGIEKTSEKMEDLYDNCGFSNRNREVGLSEDETKLESSIDSAVFSQQHHQSCNTDSLENNRGSTEKSLSIEVSVADPGSPLNLMNENTVIGLVDENNTKEHRPNDVESLKNNDFSTDVGPNSILNSHNDLKPVVVSTIDEKKLNPFRRTTSNNNNNVIPILEHANPMEPAIGFKKTDRKISQFNPWNIHTTECSFNKYRQNSTPHNKYLHVLKFEGDSNGEHMERLKDGSASNRHTAKLEGIEPSEESNNSDKANPQKRNTYKSTGAKEPETTSKIINKRKKSNVKRQASPNGNQIRGGQSCLERNTPPGVDPITYHESAHCLRYSDLWYTVYHLRRPFVEHSVRLKLYEKYDYHDKNTHWDEITAGRQTNVGTFSRVVQDETPTFSFTYMPSSDQVLGPFQLDTDKSTLLVPQPVSDQLQDKYPQARAGPSEYLLLKSDQITQDGDECDKVGVGFSAFAKQPDRCSHMRGTCLTNQPLHLWQHDHEALANDKPGKYFLKNFACISSNPFIVNKSNSDEFLAIDYHNPYSATIEIEVKSDFNGIIRPGIGAQLPEVYVDATCDSNTKIIVTIANMGLASARFLPRLANCPGGLPEVWLTAQSPALMIAPQHQHRFHLSLFGTLPIGRFHCSIDVLNDNHDIVATRRIRIQRYDRCFCLFHCLCACSASSKGLSCDQMSIEHYHAAGFMGSLPIPIVVEQKSVFEKNFNFWSYLLIAFLIGPLLLGFLKALSGVCCCTTISSAGMSLVGAGKAKTAASQEEGEGEDETGRKSAEDGQQQPNPVMQFCLNIFIFFYLIFVVIVKLLNVLCSIFCCFAICAIFNKSDSEDSESGKRKSSVSDKSQLLSTDEERHVSFDDNADANDVDGEGDGEDGEGDGDEDDDEDEEEGEEEEDEDEEDDGEPDVLKITGGDSLDDDADIDLLEYFNKPDALEGDQVKKIMKKFKQYYKSNPPDKRESKSSDEEENDDVLSDNAVSEYESRVAESFIDLLLESEEVYRHFSEPVGDIIMPEGFEYCIRGFLVKSDTGYFFIPPSPLLQYWTHDKQLMEPPQPLAFADFEKAYDSAIDVLISYDLDLMPNGPAVNVYHL